MDTFWNILIGIGAMAGFSFLGALLLSLPNLFSRAVLRRRRRLPLPGLEATEPRRPLPRGFTGWRKVLFHIIAFPFGAALFIIVAPALLALVLAGTCASYRFYRHLAYRALRRKRRAFAFPLSFPAGLMFTVRARPPCASAGPGIA